MNTTTERNTRETTLRYCRSRNIVAQRMWLAKNSRTSDTTSRYSQLFSYFATRKAPCPIWSRHNGRINERHERIRGVLIAFGVQEANEMSPLISHGPVFVQSGASRSIVIESLRSFRPLYLPLRRSPSASRKSRRSSEVHSTVMPGTAALSIAQPYVPFDLASLPTT